MLRPRRALPILALLLALAGPAAAAPLQPDDRRAHAAAKAAITRARTRAHRAAWTLTLPADATTVPDRYSVVLVANYVDHAPSAAVLTVERTPGRAVAERITDDGVHRGELPVDELDAWLRTTQHLQRAAERQRGDGIRMFGFRTASHVPYRSITVRSLDAATPLDLTLAADQPIYDDLDNTSVERFGHTWSVRTLERLMRGHLGESTRVPVDDALRREVLARLTNLPPRTGPRERADRVGTEAVLYAALLVAWRHAPAIPAVRARGFLELARQLELETMPESQRIAALGELLCGDYGLRKFSLPLARKLGAAAMAPMLAALRCPLDEYALSDQVDAVAALMPSAAASTALRELAARGPPERVLVAIDQALLLRDHDDAARVRLMARADVPLAPPELRMPDPQSRALAALHAEALRDSSRRAALVPVIRRVLASIPATAHETYSGMDALAGYLGDLGGPDDLPALHALLATQTGSVVVTIIHAIAEHDLAAAVAAARRQIARYARGAAGSSFGWDVREYHALLLRADARSAVPELQRALTRARRDPNINDLDRRGQRAIVRYLSSRTDAIRAAEILAYVTAAGALDPELLQLLRARHGADLSDAAMQAALAANVAAWSRQDTPW